MTLTELAKKHNLDPNSAMAFLREWLDMQKTVAYMSESGSVVGEYYRIQRTENEMSESWWNNNFMNYTTTLIARPTLGE